MGGESAVYSVSAVDDDFPITEEDIGKKTPVDSVLGKVHQFVMSGWPEECPDKTLKQYHNTRSELSCEQDWVFWDTSVIIPAIFSTKRLGQLHWEHPGVCGMKAIARTCTWWPKRDEEIEEAVRVFTVCQNVRNAPPSAPLIPWKWRTRPFQRIHVDFCQNGTNHFLVVINSHSKWIEAKHMTSTNAERTINELRLICATHRLPEEVYLTMDRNLHPLNTLNLCQKRH